MSYPKWVYHRELPAFIVKTEEEHKALQGDWRESPADFEKAEEPKVEPPKEALKPKAKKKKD